MSTTNESILKSLASLEQNLNDINSAKEQVNNVVKTTGNLGEIIETYQKSFERLAINVQAVLDDSRKFNLDSITKLSEQTTTFSKEITKLTELDVSKSLKSIENETIKQFQQNLSKPLESLDRQIKNIENEVAKLTEFDLKDSFSNVEKQVVNQFNSALKEKLVSLDNKVLDFQSKIEELKAQILKIENFDLESQFSRILKTLTNYSENQSSLLTERYNEVKSLNHNILLRLNQQDKEIKTLKILLLLTIGTVIISIIINLFL